jgi:bifunctional N-acetylglucosamine-1-phosphate-uridyltransferase/glucosamine-1-phosphate-acetyltransferase GlmU-like protein
MDPAAKILDPMVPDLANPPRVRKRRAPKHDFKDGKGRVFAHRHDNGGGWVADTAWVAPTVKVTRNAEVFDFARVHDNCEITGQSKVFNRARLFDAVTLSQRAAVHGHAIVRNSVLVKDDCQIFGSAHVCGDTRMNHNVHIYDHAVVINSNINGPQRKGFFSTIRGAARVLNSRLYSWNQVHDAAVLENAQIQDVYVAYSARVINSTVATNISYYHRAWTNGQMTDLPEGHAPYGAPMLITISGTLLNSHINTPRWCVNDRAQFVSCTLSCHLSGLPNDNTALHDLMTPFDRAMVGVQARSLEDITSAVNRIMNPAAAAAVAPIPAIAARGTANFEAVRQRRIMRMEES